MKNRIPTLDEFINESVETNINEATKTYETLAAFNV
jgi:hypothetical protein